MMPAERKDLERIEAMRGGSPLVPPRVAAADWPAVLSSLGDEPARCKRLEQRIVARTLDRLAGEPAPALAPERVWMRYAAAAALIFAAGGGWLLNRNVFDSAPVATTAPLHGTAAALGESGALERLIAEQPAGGVLNLGRTIASGPIRITKPMRLTAKDGGATIGQL